MKIKKGFFSGMFLACILCRSVYGAAVQQEAQPEAAAVSDVKLYLIENEPVNEKNKESKETEYIDTFWVFAEVLDEKGEPAVNDTWSVHLEITSKADKSSSVQMDLEKNDEITGYLCKENVDTVDEQEYEVEIQVKSGGQTLVDKAENINEYMVNWPSLVTEPWKEEAGNSKELKKLSRAIIFDWDDQENQELAELFPRLFTVELKKEPKGLKAEKEGQIVNLSLERTVKEDVDIVLTDIMGNVQTIPFSIQVVNKRPIFVRGILAAIAVLAVLAAAAVIVWRKKKISSEEKLQGEEKPNLQGTSNQLEEAWKNLENSITNLRIQEENLNKEIKAAKESFGTSWEPTFESQITARENRRYEIPDEIKKEYLDAKSRIANYRKDFDLCKTDWKNPKTKESFDDVICKLGDVRKAVESEISEVRQLIEKLEAGLEEVRKKRQGFQTPLGIYLNIAFVLDGKKYKLGVKGTDKGFSLDGMVPLNEKFHRTEKTMEELFGEKTWIQIYKKSGRGVILDSGQSGNLYLDQKAVGAIEIKTGDRLHLQYKRKKPEDIVNIDVEAR